MPVLPAVASTTRPPGLRSPRFSASRIIHLPARSFTDCPGFMNSALPRMVQPVTSEARFSLMRGVLPIASTTSFLMVICVKSLPVCCQIESDPRARLIKVEAFCAPLVRRKLFRFREYHLAHVDISRQESGLAVSEVVFPQPPEPVVEA